MTRPIPALLLVAATTCLAACNSQGGFGRVDNMRSLNYAADRISEREVENSGSGARRVSELPEDLARSWRRAWVGMDVTRALWCGEAPDYEGWGEDRPLRRDVDVVQPGDE